MISNNINIADIRDAIKNYACRTDGFDGAVGGIFSKIPWTPEMEKILPWSEVEDSFSECIPTIAEFHIDVRKIVCGWTEEHQKLEKEAWDVAKKICKVYEDLVNEIRRKVKKQKHILIREIFDFDINGNPKWQTIECFDGNSWKEALDSAIVFINNKCDFTLNITLNEFYDLCYKMINATPVNPSINFGKSKELGRIQSILFAK